MQLASGGLASGGSLYGVLHMCSHGILFPQPNTISSVRYYLDDATRSGKPVGEANLTLGFSSLLTQCFSLKARPLTMYALVTTRLRSIATQRANPEADAKCVASIARMNGAGPPLHGAAGFLRWSGPPDEQGRCRAGTRKSTAPFKLSLAKLAGGVHRLTVVVTFGKTPGFRPLVITQ